MRAIDTNVLVRHFRQDDRKQSPAALRVMQSGPLYCPKSVALEFEWVMRYVYQHDRADIAACLTTLISMANVTLEDEAAVGEALQWYQRGLDFADALHLASSQACTDLLTFDDKGFARRAKRLGLKPRCTIPA